ncbi:GATOR2 complex protein MIOS-like [Diadema antillarum]|uniref:GATOR2 complex protein MIOS-like n=1 Tax=Diadema antillarum TaxID=105358 RepID=UPI003A8B23D4
MTSKYVQDIQWSPVHPDTFFCLSAGTNQVELNQFVVEPLASQEYSGHGSPKPQGRQISETGFARLHYSKSDLFTNNNKEEVQRIKCFAVYPKEMPENLLAVGLSTGKVMLTSFVSDPHNDPGNLIGAAFPPKHSRLCTNLAWNAMDPKLLAVSFDKYRTDCSLLIYDVNARLGAGQSRPLSVGSERDKRAVSELVNSDALHSMSWIPHQHHSIIVGVGQKNLRLYDIRDASKYKSSTITKAVYGISVDPLFEHRLASFYEDQTSIWDLRHFEKPVLSFKEARPVVKLGWCPTRYGTLACLTKQSSVIKLYNIQHVGQDLEYTEKHVKPKHLNQHQVAMFSWHPNQENRMLALSPGGAMHDITIYDAISLDWSPHTVCAVASGRQLFYCKSTTESSDTDEDISAIMKRRAGNGYGMESADLSKNAALAGDDPHVQKLWHWLHRIKALCLVNRSTSSLKSSASSLSSSTSSSGVLDFSGVKHLMCKEGPDGVGGLRSKVEPLAWEGVDGIMESNVYRNKERSQALALCGWDFDGDPNRLREFTQRLETEGKFERAAAISIFHLKIRHGIDILNRGAEYARGGRVDLNAVAMALSGFTWEKDTLWCSMCSRLCCQLRSPYLRAMFGFLTTTDDRYEAVVREAEISIEDRVAFACVFLNDTQLVTFVQELTSKVIEDGNLEGVLLTGLTRDGINLLQSYVDRTADVQTASLMAVQALPVDLCKDESVANWIDSYRGLLDTWRLWHERAKFDLVYQGNAKDKVAKQIYVTCCYCQNAISPSELAQAGKSRSMAFARGGSGQQRRPHTCYKCRKALPRCALCLMHMGTRSGESELGPQHRHGRSDRNDEMSYQSDQARLKQTDFGQWFSWCQTCRHGGHADHITEWFKTHSECPVTACSCPCMLLDSVAAVLPSSELSVM